MSGHRMAEVFVELADTLVDEFDVADFLQVLTERCVELLEASAAGLMLADGQGRLQLAAGTSTATRDLELFELQQDEGPCLDTFAHGEPIVNITTASAEAARRWPTFTAAAADAGVRSTSALPMRLRGRVIGALNLFSDRHDTLSRASLTLGQAMADVATIGLLNERSLREKTVLTEQLQSALNSRIVIEQAKGVLAARSGITVEEAFVHLRHHARRHGTALHAVASSVVSGELLLDVPSTAAAGAVVDPLDTPADDRPANTTEGLQPVDLQILRMVHAGVPVAVVARTLGVPLLDVAQRLIVVRARWRVDSTAAAVHRARREGLI